MLVGLISDTHDNLAMVEKAIECFNTEKVELVLHAGDYVSPFVIPKFKTLKCRLVGVFGNNDGDHEFLRRRFVETGNCEIRGRFAEINVNNFKIALLHGDETDLLNALTSCNYFDAIVYGHVHALAVRCNSEKLIINPGEACGYLTGRPTVGLLDTENREANIIDI